jgi:DNA repair exonuclease SbcCD ATPase subunit
MIPKRVLLENFLSFGEPAVEIEFTDNEPLWVICGPNGVGKSAIFDAVTYALFACHRGGARNAEQLIHHGASGFRVELDFEINGRDFRISRTKATRTTQKVFSRIPGTDEWTPEHIGNAAPDVKKWVEANIGLEFEAFKASVLLRQGEADAILTATGSERLALLKTIIGADRFERISGRIHEDLKEYKDELERLHETLDNAPLVSDEELAAARTALIEAEQHRQKMQELSARANESLAGAKQWSTLQVRKANLESVIREAEERVNRATQIQGDKARLDLLSSIVPKLRTILELRDKVARSETELATENLQNSDLSNLCEINQKAADAVVQVLEMSRAQAERFDQAARGLREEIARDTKSLAIAQDLSNLREEWKAVTVHPTGQSVGVDRP